MPRYARQELVIGKGRQELLRQKTVAIVGLGALGSVAAELLSRSGIGTLILLDRDTVEESNLQRQLLYTESDLGRSKAIAAVERLKVINSAIGLQAHPLHLSANNIELLKHADLVLDCTDNLTTRFLINDYCKKNKKIWIYAAAIKTAGYVMPIFSEGPCLRCFLQPASLETCDTVGVLNTVTTTIAALQVQIAIEILIGEEILPKLYHFDLANKTFETMTVKKNPSCPACQGKYLSLQLQEDVKVVQFCSTGRYQVTGHKIDLKRLKQRWEKVGKVIDDDQTLSFKNIFLFADGRALIKAKSEEEALSLYSRWVEN